MRFPRFNLTTFFPFTSTFPAAAKLATVNSELGAKPMRNPISAWRFPAAGHRSALCRNALSMPVFISLSYVVPHIRRTWTNAAWKSLLSHLISELQQPNVTPSTFRNLISSQANNHMLKYARAGTIWNCFCGAFQATRNAGQWLKYCNDLIGITSFGTMLALQTLSLQTLQPWFDFVRPGGEIKKNKRTPIKVDLNRASMQITRLRFVSWIDIYRLKLHSWQDVCICTWFPVFLASVVNKTRPSAQIGVMQHAARWLPCISAI